PLSFPKDSMDRTRVQGIIHRRIKVAFPHIDKYISISCFYEEQKSSQTPTTKKYQYNEDSDWKAIVLAYIMRLNNHQPGRKNHMKAVLCKEYGPPESLVIEDIPSPRPGKGQIVFTLVFGTAHHALKDRAHIKPGETLLVLGAAGGVGLASVELGKLMGARVIAAASSDEKLEVCKQHGADDVINYTNEDLRERVKTLTGGNGVDVIVDPLGGNYSEPALRSIAWNGRFLVIGFAAGDIPRIPLNLTLLKGCSIVGVFWGSFTEHEPRHNQENLQELLTWLTEGKLKPHISATYPLERATDALNDVLNRKVKGKVVLLTGE